MLIVANHVRRTDFTCQKNHVYTKVLVTTFNLRFFLGNTVLEQLALKPDSRHMQEQSKPSLQCNRLLPVLAKR